MKMITKYISVTPWRCKWRRTIFARGVTYQTATLSFQPRPRLQNKHEFAYARVPILQCLSLKTIDSSLRLDQEKVVLLRRYVHLSFSQGPVDWPAGLRFLYIARVQSYESICFFITINGERFLIPPVLYFNNKSPISHYPCGLVITTCGHRGRPGKGRLY